ncbi:hypothetical protein LX64_03560 [Chitinophaga skermanii]|uniref:Uncharacterized protein n=1 Tax=Chitinophaga skermanii TaxID=331697 RepID=A0A327QDI4_9BACT|nr:hypothetical protein [Chitinophaga skermanii]RAJ02540.1 hypothetical protein LX64_03560 [Chitinophaga skermanii]
MNTMQTLTQAEMMTINGGVQLRANLLQGLNSELLADALGVTVETAIKLQDQQGNQGVTVKAGTLNIYVPIK